MQLDELYRQHPELFPAGWEAIEARLRSIAKQYKLDSHVLFDVSEAGFSYHISDQQTALAAAVDGFRQALERIRILVEQGKYGGRDKIGVRLGKVIDKYKVGKHFVLDIREDGFAFQRDERKIAEEAALDGMSIIRTSIDSNRMSTAQAVLSYKSLSQVERAFHSLKTVDLKVRPIHHHLGDRVRAHIFLYMLAYCVEWHMREAWRPLLFCDEDIEVKAQRDPVVPAERSDAALEKIHSKTLADGTPAHSFQSLLNALSGIVLNTVRVPDTATFDIVTTPDHTQQRALDLLQKIQM
jgi:hypothetical protein